ncbi:MAG: hypothetical protein ACYDDV_06880, partial [Methanoregula sp.]
LRGGGRSRGNIREPLVQRYHYQNMPENGDIPYPKNLLLKMITRMFSRGQKRLLIGLNKIFRDLLNKNNWKIEGNPTDKKFHAIVQSQSMLDSN